MPRKKKKPNFENIGKRPEFLLKLSESSDFKPNGFIYFITDGKFIKIGFTKNVESRLVQLQTGNPKKLTILEVFKGSLEIEKYLHAIYNKYKISGEWFDIINIYNKESIQNKINDCINYFIGDFTKVFTNAANRKKICGMTSRARDLYLWLIYEIDPGKDYLWLNEERIKLELNVSYNTLKGAITDLIKEVIIVESAIKGVYWINPLFFFNGSRLDKYKQYIDAK
jgi:hypothetical protein